jgi:hypothetical protein
MGKRIANNSTNGHISGLMMSNVRLRSEADFTRKRGQMMLKGLRMAIKYFTIGLLAGLLLAPRKGEETRKLLLERGKEYMQEAMDMSGGQAHA